MPLPYQKPCKVVLGVKSALEDGVGSPLRLEKSLEERGISYSIGHRVSLFGRMTAGEVPEGYSYRDVSVLNTLLYVALEYVPKSLVLGEPQDYYGLLNPKECKPVLSDMPVLISTPLGELPGYSFVLGRRWNLAYPSCEEMKSFVPVVGEDLIWAMYSPPHFYVPNKTNLQEVVLSLHAKNKNLLVLVYKDGKLLEVYNQPLLTLNLRDKGDYEVKVYSYRLRVFNLYLGLRFVSCLPGISLSQ